MKSHKKLLTLSLVAAMLLSMAACSTESADEAVVDTADASTTQDEGTDDTATNADSENETTNMDEEFKTVTDEFGREVQIPTNPQRVLGLTGNTMQALINLGIMPVGKVDDYKITEEGQALPSVGKASAINIEAIYELEPDLILAHSRHQGSIQDSLIEIGVPVYFFNPDVTGEYAMIGLTPYLGELLGKDAEADVFMDNIMAMTDDYKAQIAEKTEFKKGVLISHGDTIKAAQDASAFANSIEVIGIENIVPEDAPGSDTSTWVDFSIETITTENPDIIFIVTSSNDSDANQQILDSYMSNPLWSELDAAKNGNLMILPYSVNPNRSSPEKIIETVAELLLSTVE